MPYLHKRGLLFAVFNEICGFSPKIPNILNHLLKSELAPIEGGSIWTRRFFDKHDVLNENDSSHIRDTVIRHAISSHLKYYNKKYFVAKSPSLTFKIKYLSSLLPDSKFIYIYRDGRATIASAINQWKKIKYTYGGWWGAKPENWKSILRDNNSYIEKCTEQWLSAVEYFDINKHVLGDRYIEIKYDDLTSDLENSLTRLFDFVDLDSSEKYWKSYHANKNRNIGRTLEVSNMNYKWEKQLDNNNLKYLYNNERFMNKMKQIKLL